MNRNNETILVVEDDKQIRKFISYSLETEGYGYVSVVNAQDALSQLVVNQFSVVLLDLGLPDFDGMEVIKKVR